MTQPYQPQPEPQKENWIRRHIKLTILLAILGIAACGSIIGAIGEDEDPYGGDGAVLSGATR